MKREAKMRVYLIGAFIFSLSTLTSCSYNPFIANNHTTGSPLAALIGAGIGAGGVAALQGPKPVIVLAGLGGGALGYYTTTLRYDAGGIIEAGGQVYTVGNFVGIYVPTDKLFEPNTANLLPHTDYLLDSIADVLARYPSNNILISGNTSGFSRPRWEVRLSEERAKKVAAYLWNAGINQFQGTSTDLRKLTYVGYGDYFPLASDYSNQGIRENSRIQITAYPSTCDLGLDKRHLAMRNYGGLEDDDVNSAPRCSGANCDEGDL